MDTPNSIISQQNTIILYDVGRQRRHSIFAKRSCIVPLLIALKYKVTTSGDLLE